MSSQKSLGKDWGKIKTVKGQPENKSFSLKVPGGDFDQSKNCGVKPIKIAKTGRTPGYVPTYDDKQKRAYQSNYVRNEKSKKLKPIFDYKGLYIYESQDGCHHHVVRSPDFQPNYPEWWLDYPENLFEIVTPPFWRDWKSGWLFPPDGINAYINGRPEEQDTIPLSQIPQPSDGDVVSGSGIPFIGNGDFSEVEIVHQAFPSGTIQVELKTGLIQTAYDLIVQSEGFGGFSYIRRFNTFNTTETIHFESASFPTTLFPDTKHHRLPPTLRLRDRNNIVGLSSPGYLIFRWDGQVIFNSLAEFGTAQFLKIIDSQLSFKRFMYVPYTYTSPPTIEKLKIKYESSLSGNDHYFDFGCYVSYITGEPIGTIEHGDFTSNGPITVEFDLPLGYDKPISIMFLSESSNVLGINTNEGSPDNIQVLNTNDEVIYDFKEYWYTEELYANSRPGVDFTNSPRFPVIPNSSPSAIGSFVSYSYGDRDEYPTPLRHLQFKQPVRALYEVYEPIDFEPSFGYVPEPYEIIQVLPGKDQIPGNHDLGKGLEQCLDYPSDVLPAIIDQVTESCKSGGYGTDYKIKVFQIRNAATDEIYLSRIECCGPLVYVYGDAPEVSSYICTCPDYSRYTSYEQQLKRSSVRLREWKGSNAGAKADCKHILATKRYRNEDIPIFSDYPESNLDGPSYTAVPSPSRDF